MGLYDSYNLQNSTAIPRYQGSTVPEIEQVANVNQGRYDTAQNYMDATDQAMAQTSANPNDPGGQKILSQLNQEKKAKLEEFSNRGDLENLWRDTMLEAKDYARRAAPIVQNSKAINDWSEKLDKNEKIDPETKSAAKLKALTNYSGLQYDPSTGRYGNSFQGDNVMEKVDIPEKINKWLQEAHPEIRGSKITRDTDGEWKYTSGNETKTLPMDDYMETDARGNKVRRQGVRSIIQAGVNLDPEVMPWINQESSLEPYKQGIHAKRSRANIANLLGSDSNIGAIIKSASDQGQDPLKAVQGYMSARKKQSMLNDIFSYAGKGVVDEKKTESGQELGPIAIERMKKALAAKEDQLLPMNYTAYTGGAAINNSDDFEKLLGKNGDDAKTLAQQYEAYKSQPGRTFDPKTGKITQVGEDGNQVDVTEAGNQIYNNLQQKLKEGQDLRNIKEAAARSAGYDPSKASPQLLKEADSKYQDYMSGRGLTEQERGAPYSQIEQEANAARLDHIRKSSPRYKEFEQELASRLNGGTEQSKVWGLPNDKMKQEMGEMLNNLGGKGLGLKSGMLGFNIANGPNQGEQITAKDYDELQGKIEPVGITHSSKDGSTQLVVRANQDIQGKKTKGENMILSLPDAGGLDEYADKRLGNDQDRYEFHMDKILKTGLNNPVGRMDYAVRDNTGKAISSIRIQRNKGANNGNGAFNITVPGPSGPVQIQKDSYEGVSALIKQIQEEYLKK